MYNFSTLEPTNKYAIQSESKTVFEKIIKIYIHFDYFPDIFYPQY